MPDILLIATLLQGVRITMVFSPNFDIFSMKLNELTFMTIAVNNISGHR